METGAKKEVPGRGTLDSFLKEQSNHVQELLGAEKEEIVATFERRKGVEMKLRELVQKQDLLDFLKVYGEAIATLVRDVDGERLLSLDCRGGIILHPPHQKAERYILVDDSYYDPGFDRYQPSPKDKEFTVAGGKVFMRTEYAWGPSLEINRERLNPLSTRFPPLPWSLISAESIEKTVTRSVRDIAAGKQSKEDAWQEGYVPSRPLL